MKFYFKLIFLSCLPFWVTAQTYPDHYGTGQYVGVNVSSSNDNGDNSALNSVNGTGIIPDLVGASRFLAQATLGYNYEEVEYVNQIGIEAWIDGQMDISTPSFESTYRDIYDDAFGLTPEEDAEKNSYMSFTFYEILMKQPDFLRQKVAFALSQILVISPTNSNLSNRALGNSNYYDILYQGAFSNYRDMLYDVTVHCSMGIYLSAFQNGKADFALGTYPDENYAREIMQLFTIGLVELNNDGTEKVDANGDIIPTYDIVDVQELSRVFTGFAAGAKRDSSTASFTTGLGSTDFTVPMIMYDEYHDTYEKTMIDGTVLPAGQTGLKDVNDAIDLLFNHPNTGPFISIRLIQQLVKSNPSPAYVNRVASAFNNNGEGVRGDLGAVVKAILIDPEARNCEMIGTPQAGKLLQPMERLTNLFKAFDLTTPSGRIWFRDENDLVDKVEQSFLAAPSVFNFFTPFYAEKEFVEPNNMVSPEFQILNATSGMHYLNLIEDAVKDRPFTNKTAPNSILTGTVINNDDEPVLDLTDEIDIFNTQGLSPLLDRLDVLLCRGQLSDTSRANIENTITQYQTNVSGYDAEDAVKDAIYFIMVSPSYMILK